MSIDIHVPTLGESVSDATIARWIKKAGDAVAADEPIVELETDKVTLEVPSPVAGKLGEIIAAEGETVEVGALLARVEEGVAGVKSAPKQEAPKSAPAKPADETPAPVAAAAPALAAVAIDTSDLSPAVRRLVDEHKLNPANIAATGVGGRLTKADVLATINKPQATPAQTVIGVATNAPAVPRATPRAVDAAREERVRMSKLRQVIASRLKAAQNSAAMLTTFNEVDMSSLMKLRADYKDAFEAAHEVRLGFMGVFVQAAIQALREFPAVNAEIDGTDIIYKNYYNIGVAVGTPQGLVVPVIKDAGEMSLADTERAISDFGLRARDGKIAPDDMAGGTFTISNGGVYGSMMSTPILNPPQSGILGMHKIEKRAVVIDDAIVIRPMMYLALSYDHRIIDGREAVSFLARIKEMVEDPRRLLMGV
ncbi:MAG: 2-oxoglutarate dehydrogenase complex dihydrolipoyllysine-residue succinyltransferase [Alphaproteobacteria bacterium]|jgi:2-oxoglutarate dehydrogenase E2 component (dihydrolipoamide succinyltransferase)|nr:2-oxoglutarate dehydrogenase complex dihydrolipoyllysine-residue succinyltransferase [Alphaproteobacteria bacterium]MDA8942531.1 2-oxoglutarate dehydrogenase complex dihydrolipoyllysine-residue succinyltransferase [Alphaproteobacteria bacterium]MDG2489471.1 2-oxoglutarate dehydrogenase complex dihydrolipoyllysine-residue succinyltransferase [Alphaproteobacteria bacterium]HBV78437.1 dihydrolipoamide succinyltransferase [Alphaproteobacteria bacterium]